MAGDLDRQGDGPLALSDGEREVLAFAAGQSLVLLSQVQAVLGSREDAAAACVGSLVSAGLLVVGPRLRHQAGCYRITRSGLEAIASGLPEPRVDLRGYWREIAAGWSRIMASAGAFGPVGRAYSKREMRAADESQPGVNLDDGADWSPAILAKLADASFGLQLDPDGAVGSAAMHYPDLGMVLPHGRVAVELELEPTLADRLEQIIAAYKRKANIVAVLFLVESRTLGEPVQAVAARLGMSGTVHVQHARFERAAR